MAKKYDLFEKKNKKNEFLDFLAENWADLISSEANFSKLSKKPQKFDFTSKY